MTLKIAPVLAALLAAFHISAHAVGRLADITVYDRSQGRELPVFWHEGRAYVVGRPGNEYQVALRSKQGDDLLAVVSVDGVNVLSGETANTRQGGYVLTPWSRYDVLGWRKSMGEVAAFYFTTLGDSYAARTGRPDNVGVIGVALFKRKPAPPAISGLQEAPFFRKPRRDKDESDNSLSSPSGEAKRVESQNAPPAEAGTSAPRAAPAQPLGTGHGRREESRVHWVDFERASEQPVESITIYYDSYRNLVARGIVTAPIAPRNPQPFPGFVPDPA